MKIDSLKDLEKVLRLARKHGIETLKIDGIEFKLNAVAPTIKKSRMPDRTYTAATFDDGAPIDMPDELTPEQLLFYSAVPTGQALSSEETAS